MLFGFLIFWQPQTAEKIFIFNPHCYKSSPTTQKKKKTRLASVKDILQKKMCIHWGKCIQTHCSGMRKYSMCEDHSKNELQIGQQSVALPSTFHFLAQNVEVLQEIWIFLDSCWWIRFYAMRRCHLRPVWLLLRREGLKTPAFSHTVTRNRWERLYHRNIFPYVRSYYLTCSYGPPEKKHKRNVDNQTGENWSSVFLVLRWVVYYTCFTPVNVISLSDSTKLTFMFPHESFQPRSTGIMWRQCRFNNRHRNNWIWQTEMNIIKNTLFSFQFCPGALILFIITLKLSVSWTTYYYCFSNTLVHLLPFFFFFFGVMSDDFSAYCLYQLYVVWLRKSY